MSLDKIEQVAKIFGVCIATFAVYQYFAQLDQNRINKSFSYFDEFYGETLRSRRDLLGALSVDAFKNASRNQTPMEIINSHMDKPEYRVAYNEIVAFFERVYICVDVGECDKRTAIELLQREADRFGTSYYPITEKIRLVQSDHGVGYQCFWSSFEEEFC